MTWLTKLVGDTRSYQVRRDAFDVQEMHRSVMSLFPHVDANAARHELGVLFRVENREAKSVVLVQSEHEPTGSPTGYLIEGTLSLDGVMAALKPGMPVRYCILANATKSVATPNRRGKVKALLGPEAVHWWQKRSKDAGLNLISEVVWTTHPLSGNRSSKKLHLVATRFEGTAEVDDPERLESAMRAGFGRGKAYGCGLLSIAPITA